MPHLGWRSTRDLAVGLAALALVQLALSLAIVGLTVPDAMLAAEVALIALLGGLALGSHVRYHAARASAA